MRKFTKIVAPALIAALGFTAVAPAIAQVGPRYEDSRYDNGRNQPQRHDARGHTQSGNARIRADIQRLRPEIERAAQRRIISQKQANNLRRDANDVQRLYNSYSRNGLTSKETRTLENRIGKIRNALIDDRHRRPGR